VETGVVDRLKTKKKQELFDLVSELHTMMKDADYVKVAPFLTPYYSDENVNVNTASVEVLRSLGCSESAAKTIVDLRQRDDLANHVDQVKSSCGVFSSRAPKIEKPSFYRIYCYATVGGYTKQIETVIDLGTSGTTTNVFTTVPIPKYWRVL
jgi:type II secretory pathway component PulK